MVGDRLRLRPIALGLVSRLVESLEGFTIAQAYVDACIEQQQQIWGAVAEAVQTLSEASDIIWEGWEARTHAEDISAEQWTDTNRGVGRLYDPGTGEVCYRHSLDRGVIWPFSIPRGKR